MKKFEISLKNKLSQEKRKELWMTENSPKSQLVANNILPMNPEIGFYLTVEGLQISEDFFKEEYIQISKAYFSVMKKLDEHYKKSKLKQPVKQSKTRQELIKELLKVIIIIGIGVGAFASFFFGFRIGLLIGFFSAALNIFGVFYRNKHYSEYYNQD